MEQQSPNWELKRNAMLHEIERLIAGGANARDACAAAGVSRSQFYKWRKRRLANPNGGLRDLSRRPPAHGANISEAQRERILALAVEFPDEGCDKLKRRLKSEGIVRSSTTIQNVLKSAGLGTRKERLARAKQLALGCRGQLQKLPPRRSRTKGDRAYEKFRLERIPAQFVVQSFYPVNAPKHLGKLYLHFIFDAATEWVWFDLNWSDTDRMPRAQDAVALLESGVLQAFYDEGVEIRRIFSDEILFLSDGNSPNYQVGGVKCKPLKAAWWKSKLYPSNLLRRLKAAFPDPDTLARCLKQRETSLRAKND